MTAQKPFTPAELAAIQAVILAGGRGKRMGALTGDVPKPILRIGDEPILAHLLRHLDAAGIRNFVIATGYRGETIAGMCRSLAGPAESPLARSTLRVIDTGPDTATGGRLRRLRGALAGGTFMLTWADGLADVDLSGLLAFHRRHGCLATVTAVRPPTRFGYLTCEGDKVVRFEEKPARGPGWINGAFFLLEPAALDFIHGDDESWERDAMVRLAEAGELMAWQHHSFWQCMDTPAERDALEQLWQTGQAPWKNWAT